MSIDRRAFVQSAFAAAGGAASVASDASAQTNLRLAQAGPYTPRGPRDGGSLSNLTPRRCGGSSTEKLQFPEEAVNANKTIRDDIWDIAIRNSGSAGSERLKPGDTDRTSGS